MPIIQENISSGVQPHYLNKLIEKDAEETPAFSLIPKGDPLKNPIAQAPFDDKETASKVGVRDGEDAPAASSTDNYRIVKSWNHMLQETVKVGKKAQNLVDQAGIGLKGQYKRILDKKMKAQKTAADQILCDDSDMRAEGTGNQGSETRGGLSWCSNSAQSVEPVDALYRTPADQISTVPVDEFGEEQFQALINAHHDNTGKIGKFTALAGIGIKQKVSNWSIYDSDGVASQNYIRRFAGDVSKAAKKLEAVVNILECDGGQVELHLTRNLRWDRTGSRHAMSKYTLLGWNQGALELREGWSPSHTPLAKKGAPMEGMIDMCFALCADPTGLIKYQPDALTAP